MRRLRGWLRLLGLDRWVEAATAHPTPLDPASGRPRDGERSPAAPMWVWHQVGPGGYWLYDPEPEEEA